jgi:hypothetical protein
MNRHQLRRHWRQILLVVLFVPACLCFAMSSGCAETKTRKVTVEGPEKKYELKLESSEKK